MLPIAHESPGPQEPAAGLAFGVDPGRATPADRRRLGGPGLRSFLAIADLWRLDEARRLRILGLPPRSTYYGWVKAAQQHRDITLDFDTLVRISAVLGIHKALSILYADEAEAVRWLTTPHRAPVFGGRPPIALAASGLQDGLMTVRRFLDAARGGLYMPPGPLDQDFRPYDDSEIVLS